MHRPIYAQKKSSRLTKSCREIETLFAKYSKIRYVLASHEHLFYQPAKLDHRRRRRTWPRAVRERRWPPGASTTTWCSRSMATR